MNAVLKDGSTDVYLDRVMLVELDMNRIVNVLREAVADPKVDYRELRLDDEILIVYDRDAHDDRSARILRQYFPSVAMPGVAEVSSQLSPSIRRLHCLCITNGPSR